MIIQALGTGSAFTLKNRQTNLLITHNGRRLLVDCGSDVRLSLDDMNLSCLDIDAVYISHLHADHVGGMEWLGFGAYFDPRYTRLRTGQPKHLTGIEGGYKPKVRPQLFCQRNLMIDLWDHSLSGGMRGLEGVDATLETYFEPQPVETNGHFVWEGIRFDIVQAVHVSARYSIMDTFGLMFNCPATGKRLYHTSDVQFCPKTSIEAYYREADWILHDCETLYLPVMDEQDRPTGEVRAFMSGVHSHYDDLLTLPDAIRAKMVLIHYQDNVLRDWDLWERTVAKDGFLGLAKREVPLWDSWQAANG